MSHRSAVRNQLLEWQNRIDAAVRGIDQQMLETEPAIGDWPPSIVVAHLSDWLEPVLASGRAVVAGKTIPRCIENTQQFNEEAATRAATHSWADNSHRLHNQVELAAGFLSEIDDAEWELETIFPWGPCGTLAELFEETLHHHVEHGTELQAWRDEREEKVGS